MYVIDDSPRSVSRAPFASETGVQEFVEQHASELLGVRVVASSRSGGRGVCNIDILAEGSDGRPWIIECKHDLIDGATLRQLQRYRDALIGQWSSVAPRFGSTARPEPLLVAVGFRVDPLVLDGQLVPIVYRYHDLPFTEDTLQPQRAARVSLCLVEAGAAGSGDAHPRVSKKSATVDRLERYVPKHLADDFWRIDAALTSWPAVKATYGGKNFVRYATRGKVFAEAVIEPGAVMWRLTVTRATRTPEDSSDLIRLLQEAYNTG